jgi:hypothetical protein
MTAELEACLLRDDEQYLFDKKLRMEDPFPEQL